MYSKCELIINNVAYHVTNELKNWDDISSTFKRSDYDGVVRSFSNKFEFTGGAYDLLKTEYRKNYLSSSAAIAYYTRNNSWLWNERFRLSLDFSTFSDDGSVISINAIDNSLASLIKAKKGTQYEYSMAQIKDSKTLYYDRLDMFSSIEWLVTGETTEDEDDDMIIYLRNKTETVPLYMLNTEIAVKDTVEVYDVMQTVYSADNEDYKPFFKNISNNNLVIKLTGTLYFKTTYQDYFGEVGDFVIYKKNKDGTTEKVYSDILPILNLSFVLDINTSVSLQNGDMLYCCIFARNNATVTVYQTSKIKVEFYSKNKPVNIDIITPTTVLNRLLQSMNGGKPGITGEIMKGVDERLDNCVIIPAESARALPKAKFYTSYSKFTNWMKTVFGFVPIIEENKVRFVHRDMLFQDKVIKEIESTRDFEYFVNSSLIYSRVRVGYDKQDYESVNGKDEFRFTNEYTTGIELTDNSLELISPYRADAYGIEFLVQKRGEDTTDDTSDNDVFFVNAKVKTIITGNGPLEMNTYELVRSGYTLSGVISPDTMFNVAYAPRFMINANKRLIGASIDNLNFASSEGNSEVVIDGVPESADIPLSERLFTAGKVSFETGDLNIPSDFSGLVTFTKNGEEYKGYIENVSVNYGRAEAVKYSLIVESIEKVK